MSAIGTVRKNTIARTVKLSLPFLAILACSIVLALLGFKTVRDDKTVLLQETVRRADAMAEGMRELVERGCDEIESGINSTISAITNGSALFPRDSSPDRRAEFIERQFVIDASYNVKYPRPFWRSDKDAPLFPDNIPVRLNLAEDIEAQGRLDEATVLYAELGESVTNENVQALILAAGARAHTRKGEFDRALAKYDEIVKKYPAHVSINGAPLGMVAYLKSIRIMYDQGKPAEATGLARACIVDIMSGGIPCTLSQAMFARNALADLFRADEGEADRIRELLSMMDASFAPQRVAQELRDRNALKGLSYRHCSFSSLQNHGLVGMKWLSDVKDEAVVLMLDAEEIRRIMGEGLRKRFTYGNGCEFEILDREDRPFLASGTGRLMNPQSEEILDTGLPFSRILLRVTESDTQRRHIENRKILSMGMIGALLLIIGISMLFVLRLIIRENELADMKTNFVSSVSHEMRLPLAAITMVGEMFQLGKVRNEDQAKDYYRILTEETARLTLLTNKILDFSRMAAGRRPYNPVLEDIEPILRESVRRFKRCVEGERRIDLLVEADLPRILVDREGLFQIMFNLVDNAVKYSREDSVVKVCAYREDDWLVVDVEDRGIGMEPGIIGRIFEPFFRGEDELTRETSGTGVGLAIVKHIIDAHGAEITVKSKRTVGSLFSLRFPIPKH